MKKAIKLYVTITFLMVVFSSTSTFSQTKMNKHKAHHSVSAAASLKMDMRKLWEDHVIWTRNVILCLVDNLPGGDQAVKRLLQNQTDIGNAIKPYFGDEAGEKLIELLIPHITIAAEVVKAAKDGNKTALEEANKKWYANADEISEFLSKANPIWKLVDMKMMMNDHLKLTTDEAVQRINKNYDGDVIAYDRVHEEILRMSDMLADGIAKQCPEKCKVRSTKLVSK